MRASDVSEIRASFPALLRTQNELPVAYFDGPGGTQVPQSVVDAMSDYLLHHNANTHWSFPSSEETDAMMNARARRRWRISSDAAPNEIAFGANMTTLTFHLARALGRGYGPGDEIVVTELDHHANVAPWRALEKERGVTVRAVRMIAGNRAARLGAFRATVDPRTRLVAIGAASNALGTITDIAARSAVGARSLARKFSSMRFITRRISWSMCARGIAISSPAPPTNFTGRTSAFFTVGTNCSPRSISRS